MDAPANESTQAHWNPDGKPEVVHRCPPAGSGLMPCCDRTPLGVPAYHRLTLDPALVTCTGTLAKPADGEVMDRIAELEQAARETVVIIAGLVDGARNYTWYTDTDAHTYLDQIEQAAIKLAGVLPENTAT